MAKVPLAPIGRPLDAFLGEHEVEHHGSAARERNETLCEGRTKVQAGWGDKYVERVHDKGKLTTRERVELLRTRTASCSRSARS